MDPDGGGGGRDSFFRAQLHEQFLLLRCDSSFSHVGSPSAHVVVPTGQLSTDQKNLQPFLGRAPVTPAGPLDTEGSFPPICCIVIVAQHKALRVQVFGLGCHGLD